MDLISYVSGILTSVFVVACILTLVSDILDFLL